MRSISIKDYYYALPVLHKEVLRFVIIISIWGCLAFIKKKNKSCVTVSQRHFQEYFSVNVDGPDGILCVVFSEVSTFEHEHFEGEVSK